MSNQASSADDDGPNEARREAELRALHRRHSTRRHRSLLLHWLGQWLRPAHRADVAPLPAVVAGQVGICFAGHASVLVRYANIDIACDPVLGRRVRSVKRAVRPGLSPADLQDTALILLSHSDPDHLHRPTLAKLPRSATVVMPPRTAHLVSKLGFARVVELGVGHSVQHRGVDIYAAASRYGQRNQPAQSYILRGDGPSVYFCGDSGYFSGFAEIGRRFRPDIALLPIGGYAPMSFRERHMSPLDALYAFEDLQARIMIPIRHGAFALSYETLGEPARWLRELVRQRELESFVVPLEPGQSRVFVPPRSAARAPRVESSETSDDGIPDVDWREAQSGASAVTEPADGDRRAEDPTTRSDAPAEIGSHDPETKTHRQEALDFEIIVGPAAGTPRPSPPQLSPSLQGA